MSKRFPPRRWRKNAVKTVSAAQMAQKRRQNDFRRAENAKTPSKRFSAAQMAQKRRRNDFRRADNAKTPSKRFSPI